jgi:hypothetical protein
LKFQIVEREFRDLDEVLIWVDRNQLGRRNLTDQQRAIVMGRLYKTVKQNPILNLKPFQKDNGDRVAKFATLSGSAATARALAEQLGVSERTVRNAEKFADAVEALQEVSPEAAERVLRGEVRDALTELPKVPKEALSFVALADFQRRPTSWAVTFALSVASPDNWRCPRSNSLTDGKPRWALQALHDDCLSLSFPSRAQLTDLPKRAHSFGAFATKVAQVIQTSPKERQFAPFLYQPLPPRLVPNRLEFASSDSTLDGQPSAIEPSRQLICRQSHIGHLGRI